MDKLEELKLKKGDEIELSIDSVSFGGQGVGRIDDFVIFVNGAVTGDTVKARILKKKKNFAEAKALQILTPSPDRTQAPCKYFGTCGGCRMQDVDYQAQLEIKRRNIEDVFQRIGGFENIMIPRPLGSPEIYHYRNKMEFTFGDRAWLTEIVAESEQPHFVLGMHVPQRFDKVLDIDFCYLQTPLASEIVNWIRSFALKSGSPPYSVKHHTGFWRFLVIRQCTHTPELMVNIITGDEHPSLMKELKDELLEKFPQITSLINGISKKLSQVAFCDYETVLFGKPIIVEKLGAFEFEISSNSFFQTNTLGAEVLYQTVLNVAHLHGDEVLYDLYSGTGSIALYLSAHVKKVIGIELVENAVENAKKNMIRNHVNNCEFLSGDMRHVLETLGHQPDVIVVDPPRSGMHDDVIHTLLQISPEKIVYVSCNPSTQARDLTLLCKEKYRIDKIQPVDMFPHTYHIENVVLLKRN
jgi:23S rRNA (uracil1939-C5)-methyltransferase